MLANVSACNVWLKLLLQTPCLIPVSLTHCMHVILEQHVLISIKTLVPICSELFNLDTVFKYWGVRDWNEMFAVGFLFCFCSVDCDHEGAVVLHNCTLSYVSYGTQVMFQSSDCVCMFIVLVSLLCKIKLLFIYSGIPVSSSSMEETLPHWVNLYRLSFKALIQYQIYI